MLFEGQTGISMVGGDKSFGNDVLVTVEEGRGMFVEIEKRGKGANASNRLTPVSEQIIENENMY